MGPSLAVLLKRAAGPARRVIGISRFSDPARRSARPALRLERMRGTYGASWIHARAILVCRCARRAPWTDRPPGCAVQVARQYLEDAGVETVAADLADPGALAALPDAPTVFMLAGFKFGVRPAPRHGRCAMAAAPRVADGGGGDKVTIGGHYGGSRCSPIA
jgi:hypothetical protein